MSQKPKTAGTKKKRSKLGRAFDQTVANAVKNGEHEEDAAARVIHELIDGRKEIVRAVAATPIGNTTVVEEIVESQVEMGREEFEKGLEYVVGRASFANKTYSDSIQPTINKMQEAVIGDAGKDLACGVHKLKHHKKCRRKNNLLPLIAFQREFKEWFYNPGDGSFMNFAAARWAKHTRKSTRTLIYPGAGWDDEFLQFLPRYDRYICVDTLPKIAHYKPGQVGWKHTSSHKVFFDKLKKTFGDCEIKSPTELFFPRFNLTYFHSTNAHHFPIPPDSDVLFRGYICSSWLPLLKNRRVFVTCDTCCDDFPHEELCVCGSSRCQWQ